MLDQSEFEVLDKRVRALDSELNKIKSNKNQYFGARQVGERVHLALEKFINAPHTVLGLLDFFREYRHLFTTGKTLIVRPEPDADILKELKLLWEGHKHGPEAAAARIEAIVQEREKRAVLNFILFLEDQGLVRKTDDGWGGYESIDLEARYEQWRKKA